MLKAALTVLLVVGFCHDSAGTTIPIQATETTIDGTTAIQNCTDNPIEVVFVLDSSGSVGVQNFTVMKNFVKSVVTELNIGINKTHVGVITYNRYPVLRLHLTDYMTPASISSAIDAIPYISGITETDSALDLLTVEGFKGARPGLARVGIVITDGKSFHPNATATAAQQAKNQGINMFSVGIGSDVNALELAAIASGPDGQHVFQVGDFDSLKSIVQQLSFRTCTVKYIQTKPVSTSTTVPVVPTYINSTKNATAACNETVADILFILDTSGSLGPSNFDIVKQFVINIINDLDIGDSSTKVGVITFSNYPIKRIQLGQYPKKLDLINAVNVIPYYPGSTQTDAALDLALHEGFVGERPNAPNIAVVVTDGHSTNPPATKIAAENFKNAGVNVFAVGVGAEIDKAELATIGSAPSSNHVFYVANFNGLSSIEANVARSTCEAPLKQPVTQTTKVVQTTVVQTKVVQTTVGPTAAPCGAKVADLMFVLDSSGSVGQKEFETIKSFIKQMIDVFDVSSEYTRIGVMTFNTAATMQFGLNVYNTSTSVKDAVDHILFASGGTNTGLALETLRQTGFKNERPGVQNIAIIITDGLSMDPIATKVQARLLKESGDLMIAIGVGNETNAAELKAIASVDNRTGQSLVYEVGSFAALQELNNTVPYVACTAVGNSKPPPVTTGQPSGTTVKSCIDTIDNCVDYGRSVCSDYKPWSYAHCSAFCGFCTGAQTTPSPPCVDTINSCFEYGDYICTTVSVIRWTKRNCPVYCGFCTPQPTVPGGNETSGSNTTGMQAKTTISSVVTGGVSFSMPASFATPPAPHSHATNTQTQSTSGSMSTKLVVTQKPVTEQTPSTPTATPKVVQTNPPAGSTNIVVTQKPSTGTEQTPSPPASTQKVVQTNPPAGSTNIVVTQKPSTVTEQTPSPPTSTQKVVQTNPPAGSTNIVVTQKPSTVTEQTPSPPASTQKVVQTNPPAGSTNIVVTQKPSTGTEQTPSPPASTQKVVQTNPPAGSTNIVVTQKPSTGTEQTPSSPASTQKVVQTNPPAGSTNIVVTQKPSTGTEQTPVPPASTQKVVQTNPPAGSTNIVVTQKPSTGTEQTPVPPASTQKVVQTNPPAGSTNIVVTQKPSTGTEQTPVPPASTQKVVQTNPPAGSTNIVVTQKPETTMQTSSQKTITETPITLPPGITPSKPHTHMQSETTANTGVSSAPTGMQTPLVTNTNNVVTNGPTKSTPPSAATKVTPAPQTHKPIVTVGHTSITTGPTNGPTAGPTIPTKGGPVGTNPPTASPGKTSTLPGPITPKTTEKKTTGSTPAPTTPSPQQACASKAADLVFVIDSSGSVGQANFEKVKSFIKQVIGVLDIGQDSTRIGVITYNYAATLEFGLGKYNTSAQVLNAIGGVRYTAGGTNTGAALERLRQSGFNNQRPGVPNIAIVITDGLSSDPVATRQQARLAKESGNVLIAIGVGAQTDKIELNSIASTDKVSGANLVYQVTSFGDLQSVENAIISIACGVAIGTNPPPTSVSTPVPSSNNQTQPQCFDTISNCADYGRGVCFDYKPWADAHCASFCGKCGPGAVSTTPEPCVNTIDNCHEYGTYICTNNDLIGWTRKNCYKYCGLCEHGSVPTEPPAVMTTPQAKTCGNKLNNCDEYGGKSVCTDEKYKSWARDHCEEYCGYCINIHKVTGTKLSNNKTCPDWQLPKECTLVQDDPSCCPLPKCPEGYVLTVKTPLQN